ncbi:MAG TPA: fused MFS/spermidine synthase [Myxococcales bacterium]|nr:fused MFS/spermidine synthase [Myxococcales bacterium]
MSKRGELLVAILVHLAFFASGIGSLTAEVTWNRMLIVVVGNSLSATAMIVAIFMGGLGLGSWVGGRVLRRRSLWPYVVLEVLAAAYLFASPAVLDGLSRLFGSLAASVHDQAGLTLARVAVTCCALLLPAMLMGATFPALIAGAAPRDQRRTAYLYSINTLGAAVGTLVGGCWLLLAVGVHATVQFGLAAYGVAVVCALVAAIVARRDEQPAPAPQVAPASAVPPGEWRFLVAATFGVGFVALAYEVLLTRLAILHLGNAVSVFPLVLTGFLLGTGLGALLGTRLHGALRGRVLGGMSLCAAVALLVAPYLLLSDLIFRDTAVAQVAHVNVLAVIGLIVAPTLLLGGLLPVAMRRLGPDAGSRGSATLYAVNTAGGLFGAALVNHRLVPLIGTQGCLTLLALMCAAIGFADLAGPRRVTRWALATTAFAAALTFALPSMSALYTGKIAASSNMMQSEVRLFQEGRAATVAVMDHRDARAQYRDLFLNGVEEASTRFFHTQLFKLLGILPVLAHASDAPKDVLVIAFGAGITSGSVLAAPGVRSLDVVDLNPDIEKINDLFTSVNGDVFHQPRFHFHNDDGRNFLVTTSNRYDVISSDSTHPRAYDSWILYTEDFYRGVKSRLKPQGVFAQWVPVDGSMQGELFRIHLNTFRSVFPNATFWYVPGSDQAFLLATPEPLQLDAARLQRQLDQLPAWFRARDYQIDTVARVAGFFWLDPAAMGRLTTGVGRTNTDDAHYFDREWALQKLAPQYQLPAFQSPVQGVLRGVDAQVLAAAAAEQATAMQLGLYHYFDTGANLARAFCQNRENGDARFWMGFDFPDGLGDPDAFCRAQEIRDWRAVLGRHPDNPEALNALADLLAEAGQLDEALPLAEKAVAQRPGSGMILDTKGWIYFKQNRHEEAVKVLTEAARLLPDQPVVLAHLEAARKALRGGATSPR